MDENMHRKYIAFRVEMLNEERDIKHERFYEDTKVNLSRIKRGDQGTTTKTITLLCNYYKISVAEFYDYFDEFIQSEMAPLK